MKAGGPPGARGVAPTAGGHRRAGADDRRPGGCNRSGCRLACSAPSPTARRSTRWCWPRVSPSGRCRGDLTSPSTPTVGVAPARRVGRGAHDPGPGGSHPRGHGWPRVDEVHAICERLLAPNADGSIRTERAFRRELRRQIAVHTPDPAADRDEAVAERTAYASLDPLGTGGYTGTGCLTVTGEAGRVAAAIERVDDVARRLRGEGDERTLTQLRSDVTLDLLLYGWARPCDVPDGASSVAAGTFVGQAPAARVSVVVSSRHSWGRSTVSVRSPASASSGRPRPAAGHGSRVGVATFGHRPDYRGRPRRLDLPLSADSRHGGDRCGARRHLPGTGLHDRRPSVRHRPRPALARGSDRRVEPLLEASTTSQPQDARHLDRDDRLGRGDPLAHRLGARLHDPASQLRRLTFQTGQRCRGRGRLGGGRRCLDVRRPTALLRWNSGDGATVSSVRVERVVTAAQQVPRVQHAVRAAAAAAVVLSAAVGLSGCSQPAKPLPSASATPRQVLDAYLLALQAGTAPRPMSTRSTSSHRWRAVWSGERPGVPDRRVPSPTQPGRGRLAETLTIKDGDQSLPDGDHEWFHTLRRQPSGAWRLSAAGSGP